MLNAVKITVSNVMITVMHITSAKEHFHVSYPDKWNEVKQFGRK